MTVSWMCLTALLSLDLALPWFHGWARAFQRWMLLIASCSKSIPKLSVIHDDFLEVMTSNEVMVFPKVGRVNFHFDEDIFSFAKETK